MSTLNREQWQALSPYLDQAFQMDESERELWLADLCSKNPGLGGQLKSLLQEHAELEQEGFMAQAPINFNSILDANYLLGQEIGPYTLISQIGQGGMGNVWLAERNDGRFQRKVAIKFIHLALIGHAAEERFRREGAILGALAHPNIAELIDAGVSSRGLPYLVLEYVDGEPIDRFCDHQKLDIHSRIRLFLDVIGAVAHAHANLIVHRDLKPSNVLVNKSGQVKLLDFGIAKIIAENSDGGQTALTKEAGNVMTPEFAAPEQMTGAPVTTATDVYALGVLFYLLLAGNHPLLKHSTTPAEMMKSIIEVEPARLSTVVTSKVDPTTAALVAEQRATSPAKLRQILEGDLETIVSKTLKKAPQDRYASATDLADDLRRYLDHEPIKARPDSLSYRAGKFIRRNRVVVGLMSLALVAIVAGVIGVLLQVRTARVQRDFAFEQLRRSEDHDELLNFLLYDAAPKGKMFSVEDLLARAEQVVEKQQSSNAARRADLWMWIAGDYASEDQLEKGRILAQKAYDLSRDLPDPTVHARAACVLAQSVSGLGDWKTGINLVQEGLRGLPNDMEHALDRLNCLGIGGSASQGAGKMQDAIQQMEMANRLALQSPLVTDALRMRTAADLATVYGAAGRNRDSLAEFERAASFLPALGYEDTVTAAILFDDWALELDQIGRTLEAEQIEKRAMQILQEGDNLNSVTPMYLINYAKMLSRLNRLDEASDFAQRAYDKGKEGQNKNVTGQSLLVLARIAITQKQFDRASALLSELDPMLHKLLPPGHYAFATLTTDRALIALGQGNVPLALSLSSQALTIGQGALKKGKAGSFTFPTLLLNDSQIALSAGKFDQALSDADQAIALEKSPGQGETLSAKTGNAYLSRARALQALGRREEAHAAAQLAIESLTKAVGPDNPATESARQLSSY